jgi:hypothetical protein
MASPGVTSNGRAKVMGAVRAPSAGVTLPSKDLNSGFKT